MEFWTVIPSAVRKSKRLSAEEKELYYEIFDRTKDIAHYCTATNEELAKALGTSAKTVSARLSSLVEKRFANIFINARLHRRYIYLLIPSEPSNEQKPTDKDLDEKTKKLIGTMKKAIVLGDVDFGLLIQSLQESSYLDEVEDNSTQFILTAEQIEFLINFKKRYPGKNVDCQVACFSQIDYKKLIHAIEESFFLQGNNNLSLKWCLSHAQEIMSGKYKTSFANSQEQNKNFTGRNYASDEINSLFQSIDDIII